MGLATLPQLLRRFFARVFLGSLSSSPDPPQFEFETRYKMIILCSQEIVTLDDPVFDTRSNKPILMGRDLDRLPHVLDFHGDLIAPITSRRAFYKHNKHHSSVYLEYRFPDFHKATIILKFTGMKPQKVQVSLDGRSDITKPLLVFIPKSRIFF